MDPGRTELLRTAAFFSSLGIGCSATRGEKPYLLEDLGVGDNDAEVDVDGRGEAALELELSELDSLQLSEIKRDQRDIMHDTLIR